jgi:hypothetical protein
MKYLKIQNDGLLDIRLIYLMGGTTKADDKFKIGQFGTGLKYALAYMLRNNIDFKVFIDGDEIKLSTVKETIRDTNFEIICINGQKTSITTNMGTDWKAWMIVRELWCNALDEIKPVFEVVEDIIPTPGTTEYYIQFVPDIMDVYEHWDKYFIHGKAPIMEVEKFAIYDGGESLRCYKNGVLIKEITGKKSIFSYDIKDTELNELREMKYSVQHEIAECFPQFTKETVEIFFNNLKDTFEEDMDFSGYWDRTYGSGWKEAIGNAKFIDYETYNRIIDRYPDIENQPLIKVPPGLFKKLVKAFPSISMLRASDKLNEFFETYSDTLHDKIKKCVNLLDSVGYFIDPNLKIITGIFGNKEIIGQVSFDDKEIRLNKDLENMADSDLIVCLIEENEHYKTGLNDMTRAFQTHFIKLYSNLLLKKVEVLI